MYKMQKNEDDTLLINQAMITIISEDLAKTEKTYKNLCAKGYSKEEIFVIMSGETPKGASTIGDLNS
jgi:hypothetical protein